MSQLPAYIDRGGAQTYAQPLQLTGCRFYSFVLDAAEASLQAVCDRYLNGPAGGRAEYRPLFGCAVLGAAVIDAIRCLDRPPAEQFSITETDIAFWLPVLRGRTVAGVFIAESLQWFLPYVFVNNTWAVALRKELADQNKIVTFTDFGKWVAGGGQVKLAASAEFVSSPAALPKFQSVYGFTLKPDQLVTLSGGWVLPMLLVAAQLAVVAALVGASLRR